VPEGRDPIPADLERALFIEAGYRCAIPTCRVIGPLEIDHIEDWAKVKEHKFANMIVLCANCHGLKGEGPRKLDRKALRQIKANLGIINGRYGETERRVLAFLIQSPKLYNGDTLTIKLPGGFEILIHYLLEDGILTPLPHWPVVKKSINEIVNDYSPPMQQNYLVTEAGRTLIAQLRDAQPLL
jgi:HNH endonuclease